MPLKPSELFSRVAGTMDNVWDVIITTETALKLKVFCSLEGLIRIIKTTFDKLEAAVLDKYTYSYKLHKKSYNTKQSHSLQFHSYRNILLTWLFV